MNILLLGSGGREHAFAWSLTKSPKCGRLFIAPGNAGTALHGTNVDLSPNDFEAVGQLVKAQQIDMLICGPEEPLVRGIQDYFAADAELSQVAFVGPSRAAAQLEGSKAFAKEFMAEFSIPTAGYRSFGQHELANGIQHIDENPGPYVLKADGLAAGKGVVILEDPEEAKAELKAMLGGKFGAASEQVVIEQFLSGIEFSVFAAVDGQDYRLLPVAKDYKRVGEGDTGPNTGGMGSVSHPPFVTATLMQQVEDEIVRPTIEGLLARDLHLPDGRRQAGFRGFVFFGLINVSGSVYVIEYNVRMGDPETQSVFPRLKSDLVELCHRMATGGFTPDYQLEFDSRQAASVVLVSGGYPGQYEKGKVISGLDQVEDSIVFHAGVKSQGDQLLTNGGRVLAITSYGDTIGEAVKKSMENAGKVKFEGVNYRRDIGADL
ncbi:MAG: phosphoribosylamine--glycine ligase [Bacteroidota bacterium]